MKNQVNIYTFSLRWIILVVLSFFPFKKSVAEDSLVKPNSSIMVIAKPAQDSIILRWAPINFEAWEAGNKYGYKVFRSVLNKKQTPVELTSTPIKLSNPEKWKDYIQNNKYAAIAAQSLFGDTFRLEAAESTENDSSFTKANEQQQRFSIALFAADLSADIARLSGLYFADKTAVPGENYLYYIVRDTRNDPVMKTDTGFVISSLNEFKPLPVPADFKVKPGDKQVLISWNAQAQLRNYIAYYIEKSSDDGKSFSQIHSDPIAYIVPNGNSTTGIMYKFDSLQQNNKVYYYRIRGISSFGEYGPYSEPFIVVGKAALTAVPDIYQFELLKEKVKIFWNYPVEAEKDIVCFKILRSTNDQNGFLSLNEKISVKSRNFIDNLPLGTGYYKIIAWQDSSNQKESFPFLVQLSDSIPPARPEDLTGTADTSGIIKLKWTPNKEKDLYGYRVFRSASNNDEFSQLTSLPIVEPTFTDTISKKDLNNKAFYKIMAVDQRQNESEYSKILEVKKPDLIPPSAPNFKSVQVKKDGVYLSWTGSSSLDLAMHTLYRKYTNDSIWIKIKEFPSSKKNMEFYFIDKMIDPGKATVYKIEAVDAAMNRSKPDLSIEIQAYKPTIGASVSDLKKSIDDQNGIVKISWKKPINEADVYWIYRKTSSENYSLYATVEGTGNSFTDKGLKAGNQYFYRVKVLYKDKSISAFSEEINCNF